jgi:hypothetical protein
MGANSTQGWALLLFLVGFVCLAGMFFTGGSLLLLVLFLAVTAGSVGLFLKAKPWEHAER